MEFHKEQLQKCCRVCGRRLKNFNGKGRSFACTSNSKLLLETFSIDVSQDHSDTHPPEYCFNCQGVIRRKVAADKKGLPYNTHTTYNLFLEEACMELDLHLASISDGEESDCALEHSTKIQITASGTMISCIFYGGSV